MNAIMKYPGSKWSIANWIISFFPEHHSYLEPFLGSGAVLFNKPRSDIETVNDLDGNVVNLFEWIKRDPERLAYEIYWTPYSRQIYDEAFQMVPEDSLQKAVNFYIRLNMGQGFRTNGKKVGWKNDIQGRERAYAAVDWVTLPGRIIEAAELILRMYWKPGMESSIDVKWMIRSSIICWMCCWHIKDRCCCPAMTTIFIMTAYMAGTGRKLSVIPRYAAKRKKYCG